MVHVLRDRHMVFLIQHTQNRDSKAVHIKLDEIIRALHRADDRIIAAELDTDEELDELERKFEQLHARVTGARNSNSRQTR